VFDSKLSGGLNNLVSARNALVTPAMISIVNHDELGKGTDGSSFLVKPGGVLVGNKRVRFPMTEQNQRAVFREITNRAQLPDRTLRTGISLAKNSPASLLARRSSREQSQCESSSQ
jgi:hypothetical protein